MKKIKLPRLALPASVDGARRRLLGSLMAGSGLAALGAAGRARAQDDFDDLRFPGDEPEHKIVYQFNQSEHEYHEHVLNSASAMLRAYPDNIHIVVTCFARGIHILAHEPARPVAEAIQARVKSLNFYGVEFHACGRTLEGMGWTEDDIVDFAKVVPVGAADLMELQEQGYAYLAW
jgi:intracellular sulfur oxidation DsrE/DsrF family protein